MNNLGLNKSAMNVLRQVKKEMGLNEGAGEYLICKLQGNYDNKL